MLLSIFIIQWLLFLFTSQPTPFSPIPRFQFLSFSHPFSVSRLWTSFQPCFLSQQFTGLRSGFFWRPSYSFEALPENKVQPIRALVAKSPFPLFQPPQVEEESPSEVNPIFCVACFAPCLFAVGCFYVLALTDTYEQFVSLLFP